MSAATAPAVKPGEKKKTSFGQVWPMIRKLIEPRRGMLALGFLLMGVNRVSGLVLPASTKWLIDDVIGKRDIPMLLPLVGIVVAATLVQGATSFALTQLLSKEAQRLIAEMRRQVQAHISRLPVAFYDANRTGSLVSRIMSDVEGVRNLIGTGLVEFAGGILTAVISLVVLLRINATMTLITATVLIGFALVLNRAFSTMRPIFRERGKINAEVTGRLTESLGAVRTVKGYHAEEREQGVFMAGVKRLLDNVLATLTAQSAMQLSSSVLLGLVGAIIMFVGTVKGDVAFEDVDFAYEADKPVLKDVSFLSPAGTVTALVGSSGSGKSTIIGLIAAFHSPNTGRVTVDGVVLSRARLETYRTQLGVVLQDTFLFAGSIRENVAFSRPFASEAQIQEACRIARVDEFADRFPDRLDTVVGERGVKLSGGQRQRVSIARAILADPRILILDEATSSLDSESEAHIQAGLQHLMAGRTTFVIAHRLSTIRRADQILVVEDGRIVERGNHQTLYAAKGRYRDLYDRQHGLDKNLFLAPGEGDTVPDGDGSGGGRGGAEPGVLDVMRGGR